MSDINSLRGKARDIAKNIEYLGRKYNTWNVFSDFLLMAATAISNAVDPLHYEAREKSYVECINQYTELEERRMFPQMFAWLVDALEEELDVNGPADVLGKIFHALELHNKYKGQFFTPQNISDMMAEIVGIGNDVEKQMGGRGFVSMCEPTCGSGVMVISFAKMLLKRGLNPGQHMVATAGDVDLKCAHMAYVQLSLYGIPTVVLHANTLTVETFSRWYTPAYIWGGWLWRCQCSMTDSPVPEDEALRRMLNPTYAALRDAEALMKEVREPEDAGEPPPAAAEPEHKIILTEKKHGQLSLF